MKEVKAKLLDISTSSVVNHTIVVYNDDARFLQSILPDYFRELLVCKQGVCIAINTRNDKTILKLAEMGIKLNYE